MRLASSTPPAASGQPRYSTDREPAGRAGRRGRCFDHQSLARSAPCSVAVLNKWVGNATRSTSTTVIAAAQSALWRVSAFFTVGRALSVLGDAKCVAFVGWPAAAAVGRGVAIGDGVGQ